LGNRRRNGLIRVIILSYPISFGRVLLKSAPTSARSRRSVIRDSIAFKGMKRGDIFPCVPQTALVGHGDPALSNNMPAASSFELASRARQHWWQRDGTP